MRIFYHPTIDLLMRRLVPGICAAALAGWGIAQGGPVLENVPGLIPSAQAVELAQTTPSDSAATAQQESVNGTASDSFADGTYADGVYTGTAAGFGGDITVQVTISGGKITDIAIVSAPGETAAYFAKAKGVISGILAAQSPNVDAVSGATYSSNGMINAVKRALSQALTSGSAVNLAVTETDKKPSNGGNGSVEQDGFTDPSAYQDGTYTGTAEGYGGDIAVQVTILGGKITDIAVISAPGETASYFAKAKGVISSILATQSPNVDVVSGATYSSNGMINAVKRALAQAAVSGNEGNNTPDEEPETQKPSDNPEDTNHPEDTEENTQTEDQIYSMTVSCVPDEAHDFDAYDLTLGVTVRQTTCVQTEIRTKTDGIQETVTTTTVVRRIVDLAVTDPDSTSSNWRYLVWAMDGRNEQPGLRTQAVEKQSFDGLDVISRATCSSHAVMQAGAQLSLQLGTTITEETE